MSARTLIGNVARRMVGKRLYTRLRFGLQAEHSYLWKAHGIIHIGANAGQERELYAAFGLYVMWIEPIPEVFEALRLNISEFPKQRAYNYLVAGDDGKEYTLHIADNAGASSSTLDLSKHTAMYPQTGISDLDSYSRILILVPFSMQEIRDQCSPLRDRRGADGLFFGRLTRLGCWGVINSSDTMPTFLLRLQIL